MEYVIAVRRDKRTQAPDDWQQIVLGTPGVFPSGDPVSGRLTVRSEPGVIATLEKQLGEYCHFEPLQRYQTSGPT